MTNRRYSDDKKSRGTTIDKVESKSRKEAGSESVNKEKEG